MGSKLKLPRLSHSTGIHAQLERLGLKTYNGTSENCTTRAVFRHEPVIRLYKLEVPALFGLLVRDDLDREDPKLFEEDLDKLLQELGPLIWPAQGDGNREHLQEAQDGTLYEADLVYPRDTAILKDRLRGLILAKRLTPGTDVQALIEKRHKDARLKVLGTTKSALSNRKKKVPASCTSEYKSSHKMATGVDSFYEQGSAMARQGPRFDCFNSHDTPRGHYYSTPELYARGVWVGYLAPDKQNKSYLGLPSYQELKANWKNFRHPFPLSNTSISASNREAVCCGCLGEGSMLLALREMQFGKGRSVVIMPLGGDDEIGMFCIVLPQPLDRSIKDLQTWRPYEIRNGGYSNTFDNNIMLITLRNTNRDIGTVDTVREILGSQGSSWKPASRVDPLTKRPSRSNSTSQKRDCQSCSHDVVESTSKRLHTHSTETPIAQLSDLTDEQAQKTFVILSVDDDGYDYELAHTMSDCKSFQELLNVLQEEAEYIPSAAVLLRTTDVWRLSYSLPDGTRKAVVARKGSETAFNRLRNTLAQPSLWTGRRAMLEVELKAMT